MPNDTFVVAVISPERAILASVSEALETHPKVSAVWTLNEYPAPGGLTQIRDAPGGCIVFLDFTDPLRARAIAAELDRAYPTATTIAVHFSKHQQDLVEFLQLGIRDLIAIPMLPAEIVRVCDRAARRLRREPEEEAFTSALYAFLPARPGSGATTISAHSAAAAARLGSQPTLLIDFDLRLGMTSFMFKLHGEQSVLDALTFQGQWDDSSWGRALCRRGELDILGSAPFEYSREPHESAAASVLDYARSKYGVICVDLPGEMREHELETIHRAREIFLVCTSELGTLHMAKRKADFLRTLDVGSRVSVIMNRSDARGAMPIKHVEEILQLPVRFTVPVAEKEITAAIEGAVAIEGRSGIASQLEKIARRMAEAAGTVEGNPISRRFIDFFSVTPIREKAGWKG
jgi:Flp pilus assembly CpaE family ATPase